MKKIGILTFHKSINYGSVLQAWSLQQVLFDKGYSVQIIDYEPRKYKSIYGFFADGYSVGVFKHNLKVAIMYFALKHQEKLFFRFRKKQLLLSEKAYTYEDDFEKVGYIYDCIVCGSDQIWNVHAWDCDSIYFLPIDHNCQKIAYAVSINNMDFTERECTDKMKANILDFDFLSVRESSGARKLEDFIEKKKKVYVMLDPTLLLNKSQVDAISSRRLIRNHYVFMYCVKYQESTIEAARIIAQKLNMPVYTIMMARDVKSIYKITKLGIRVQCIHTSPEDFISFIKYADFVVSNSFHGTAFSILLEKQFISINDRKSTHQYSDDERILNILDVLNIKERYITAENAAKFNFKDQINYSRVTPKRLEMALNCVDILCKNINK